MNRSFVADASTAIAWVASTQATEASDALLRDIAAGRAWVVPSLWLLEVANALLILKRRKRIDGRELDRGRQILKRLRPEVDSEWPPLALEKLSNLAEELSLSVYDATYLELAFRRQLPLASRDAVLNRAAKAFGVKTLLA